MTHFDPTTDRLLRRLASQLPDGAHHAAPRPVRSFADRVIQRIDCIEQANSLRALNARADLRGRLWLASAIAVATLAGSLLFPQLSPPSIKHAAAVAPLSASDADAELARMVDDAHRLAAASLMPFPIAVYATQPPARH